MLTPMMQDNSSFNDTFCLMLRGSRRNLILVYCTGDVFHSLALFRAVPYTLLKANKKYFQLRCCGCLFVHTTSIYNIYIITDSLKRVTLLQVLTNPGLSGHHSGSPRHCVTLHYYTITIIIICMLVCLFVYFQVIFV